MVSCNYIAGEWVEGPERLRNTNPSDISDVIGEYAAADAAQTETAIDAANAAFVAWRKCSIQQRAEVLNRVADEVLARKDELGHLLDGLENLPHGDQVYLLVVSDQKYAISND